jgi:hypothetical protein
MNNARKGLTLGFPLLVVICIWACAVLAAAGAQTAKADEARSLNPNAISLEIFGKGLLYTVQYDRAMTEDFFAGIGVGTVGIDNLDGSDANATAVLVPVYAGYYFMREQGSPYVEIGASIVANNSTATNHQTSIGNVQFSSNQVLPHFGAGWETRTDQGFLFRVTGYGIVGKTLRPWFGATLGYAF